MHISQEPFDETLVLHVHGNRIDAAEATNFKELFCSATQEMPHRVVLNLKGVDFIDSSGLGAIVRAMKMLGPNDRLELCHLEEAVQKVFRLTRMDSVFSIYETLESALKEPDKSLM